MSGLLSACRDALAELGESDADLHVARQRRGCARFSIGELSQHMDLEDVTARARVAKGGRVAEVATTSLERASLIAALRRASALAERAPEIEGWDGVAAAGGPTPVVPRFETATSTLTGEDRVELLRPALARIAAGGLAAAGMLETSVREVAVASTRGAAREHRSTLASLAVWALEDAAGRGASGYAARLSRDVRELAIDDAVEQAIAVARASCDRGRVEAGTWDVVLEAPAIAELLEWLGMIAFAAPEVEAETSPLAGRLGERITGEHVAIVEDPLDAGPQGLADPFDREGTPRRRVELVTRGVASGVLTDRVYARRSGTTSTGSAVTSAFDDAAGVGPVAPRLSIDVEQQDGALALARGMERGLWIKRLHYVNGLVEPRRAVMTGLSRDGCFFVERGRSPRAVGNVRMTDSFLEMLGRADGVTRETVAVRSTWTEGATLVVPAAIRLRGVRFTSGSQ